MTILLEGAILVSAFALDEVSSAYAVTNLPTACVLECGAAAPLWNPYCRILPAPLFLLWRSPNPLRRRSSAFMREGSPRVTNLPPRTRQLTPRRLRSAVKQDYFCLLSLTFCRMNFRSLRLRSASCCNALSIAASSSKSGSSGNLFSGSAANSLKSPWHCSHQR
jgi:hypothetical protein